MTYSARADSRRSPNRCEDGRLVEITASFLSCQGQIRRQCFAYLTADRKPPTRGATCTPTTPRLSQATRAACTIAYVCTRSPLVPKTNRQKGLSLLSGAWLGRPILWPNLHWSVAIKCSGKDRVAIKRSHAIPDVSAVMRFVSTEA
jgi:hypothetical protein